jgi:hypothetical protein
MGRASRYSPEVRERAVRMLVEHQAEHESHWAAIGSIAAEDRLFGGDPRAMGAPGRAGRGEARRVDQRGPRAARGAGAGGPGAATGE